MSIAAVTHSHIFGINANIRGNLQHIDDSTIVYSAGSSFVLFNTETMQQRVVSLAGNQTSFITISSICFNHSKKVLAVAEKALNSFPVIHIYDIQTLRKKKTLVPTFEEKDINATCLVMSFSPDGKYLITQFNNHAWSMHLWVWDKAKSIGQLDVVVLYEKDKINKTGKQAYSGLTEYQNLVTHIDFSPKDDSMISLSGNSIIKILKYQDGTFKSLFTFKSDLKSITGHTWLNEDRILISTSEGSLLVADTQGDIKFQIMHTSTDGAPVPVYSVATYTKGFIFGDSNSVISIFHTEASMKKQKGASITEAVSGNEAMRKLRDIKVCQDTCTIVSMSLSPCEDTLVCVSSDNRLFGIALNNADIKGEEPKLQLFNYSFHFGPIVSMDVCVRKPLLVTASTDHSVRVWNYSEKTCDLIKNFQEDIYSISVHPSGLYLLIGFSDKLRLMNLLLDDLRCYKEFSVRACRECKFSSGGQFFAAVSGNTIQIFNTWTFINVANLKGHNGKIRSLSWSKDDTHLISAGADGAIYTWSLVDMGTIATPDSGGVHRENEHILKGCNYSSAVCSGDGKQVLAVGSDKSLKEIEDSQVTKEILLDSQYTQILLSHSSKMLFAGTVTGSIRSLKYPLDNSGSMQYQEHIAHSSQVAKLLLSHDDQYLFSISDDGCLFMYKVDDKDSATKKIREYSYADEILITKAELEEKNNHINELKSRVEELKLENEYQLRLKDMNFNDKIKQVTEKFQQELDALKITSSIVKTEKEKELQRHEEEIKEEKEKHVKVMNELDSVNTAKLMSEYDKYEKLQLQIQNHKIEWQRKIEQLNQNKEQTLKDLHQSFELKVSEKQAEIEQLQNQVKQQLKDFEETVKETEEDADTEVMQLKQQYELRLQNEKETGMRLKSENAIMRKRFNTLQSEIEAHKSEISKLMYEEKKLYASIKGLEKDISSLKKEIQERDETVQDKEKRIYDLKKKNQELEKFKFVLDYKIKELKKQIEPREQDIQGMTSQIKDMDEELQVYNKDNTELNLKISDLKLKLKAADQEITKERQKWMKTAQAIKKFKVELNDCVQSIQDPKLLKQKVKKLYHRFCIGMKVVAIQEDGPTEKEFMRHRDYLEHMISSMKQKMSQEQESHIVDTSRMIKENTALIHEINSIRKELTVSERKTVKDKKSVSLPQLN